MSARTRGALNTITGTVGTASITVLFSYSAINYIRVISPSQSGFIAVTYDGVTTPICFSSGYTIAPLSSDEKYTYIPLGNIQIVGNSSSTPFTVEFI